MNQPDNIINKLRIHTSALHSALEQTPLSLALLDEHVSLENYISYLQRMRQIVAFYEINIFPILAHTLPDLTKREKLQLIDKDLKYLSATAANTIEFKNPASVHHSIGYALGCLYVMEGSILGGKVILKHITKVLGIVATEGGSYFAGYGEETGHYWKSFLHILHDYSTNHDADDEIICGAKDTFTSIKYYFEQ